MEATLGTALDEAGSERKKFCGLLLREHRDTGLDWGLESPQNPRAGKPALRGVNQARDRIFYEDCLAQAEAA